MIEESIRKPLIEIGKGKIAALKVIEQLRPFVEEMEQSGSIILKRKLDQHAILINKIFNDIIGDGQAKQQDVIELKVCLKDLKEIYTDLRQWDESVKLVKGTNG
jgi:hypothetical protein